jgi:hypothetical protein
MEKALNELSEAIKTAWPLVFGGETPDVQVLDDFPEADYEQVDTWDYSEKVV